MSQQMKNGKGQKRPLFIELSEESYSLLMKGQVSKSLEKIKEAETQLYRQVGKSAQSKMKVEISNMYYIKGLILDRMQDLDKSLLAYLDAYKANPNNKSICNNLGKVQLQLHHYEEAEFYLRQALQLDERLLQAYVNLAFLYFETRRLNACIIICEEAMKRNIRDYMLHEYLGICHAELHQQFKESLEHLGEYMAACEKNGFKPSFLSLQYSGLGYFFYESKYEESLKYATKAIAMYPQERDALFLRAQIYYQLDRVEEAEEDLLQYAVDSNLPFQIANPIEEKRSSENISKESSSPMRGEREISLFQQKQGLILHKADQTEDNIRPSSYSSTEEVTSMNGKTFKIKNTLDSSESEREQQIIFALGSPPRLRHQVESQVVNVLEQLNVYFVLGLIYMKAAGKQRGDKARVLQEKAKRMLEKAKILDPSKENMSILINDGMLQEQMSESEESYKTLESCQFLHFEKSNDEAYLNSDSYHPINKIILHVFKLTLLQKFQENLKKLLLDKEIEAENYRGKKSITEGRSMSKEEQQQFLVDSSIIHVGSSKIGSEASNNNSQNPSNFSNYTPLNLTNRKRKASLGHLMSVRFELEDPIRAVAADIEATKGEVMKTLIEQLNGLNKQRLVKIEKGDQKLMKTTMLDVDNSFISNPMCLTHNISNSIIGEEQTNNNNNNRSNMGLLASYLQTCENLDDDQKTPVHFEDIGEEGSDEFEGERSSLKKQGNENLQETHTNGDNKNNENEDENICSCEFSDDEEDEEGNGQENKDISDGNNLVEKKDTNNSQNIICSKCGRQKKKIEENEESKRQKIREQEKERIILNAKHAYERELKENNERIQQLKVQTGRIKEQEYIAEKNKHYAKIKNIQKDVDDLSQKARVLLGLYNPSLFFTPECTSCITYGGQIPGDLNGSHRKIVETPIEIGASREGSNSTKRSSTNKQEQATVESTAGSTSGIVAVNNSSNRTSESNPAHTKPQCRCDEMKQDVERLSAFLQDNIEQRDLFFAFKRIAKTVFLQSRSVIDMSYYRKRNITISSLAEMSLGFVPLFQPDMCKLNANDTQMNVLNNEDLVKRCYFVISLADSLEDLTNLFDSLSSTLSVFLSPCVKDFLNSPSALLWAAHMKSVFSVLKNFYEISFDLAGESFGYFIFYQFFAKFAINEQDQEKYKSLQLSQRSKFLFNFIRQNSSFSPADFFQVKKESVSKSDPIISAVVENKQSGNKKTKKSTSSIDSIQSSYRSSEELSSVIQKDMKRRKDQQQSNDKCACSIF